MVKLRRASACILIAALVGCAGLIPQKTVHERTCETVETVWDADSQDILIIEYGCTMAQLEEHGFGWKEIAGAIGGVLLLLFPLLL